MWEGMGSMTHKNIETITFRICLVICAHTQTDTNKDIHTHTYTDTHFDTGMRTPGLPSLQALVLGKGVFAIFTNFSGSAKNYAGWGWNSVVGEGVFFRLTGSFSLDVYDI